VSKKILIIYHSQSGNTEAAALAVAEGVNSVKNAQAILKKASDTSPEDFISCAAVCFGSPDYFGYMAGMLKDFFDRTYYPTRRKVNDKPCGIFVTHGGEGRASKSIEQTCRSFCLMQVGKTVLVRAKPDKAAYSQLHKLGIALAESV